ncbi:MAG: DUF202 domain-containing protein [Lachnospiraceae bacterium]|nr:DUF202 domain-containing protein [Lachnospiraceae bacterium]
MNSKKDSFRTQIESGTPRKMPGSMKKKQAMAFNQNNLAMERTELSKIRTDLAFHNSRLSAEQTHLAYLRTIVTLVGSGATVYKALPVLGISEIFSTFLAAFLIIFALYFIYKDITTYPRMKRYLDELEQKANELATKAENQVYQIESEEE